MGALKQSLGTECRATEKSIKIMKERIKILREGNTYYKDPKNICTCPDVPQDITVRCKNEGCGKFPPARAKEYAKQLQGDENELEELQTKLSVCEAKFERWELLVPKCKKLGPDWKKKVLGT